MGQTDAAFFLSKSAFDNFLGHPDPESGQAPSDRNPGVFRVCVHTRAYFNGDTGNVGSNEHILGTLNSNSVLEGNDLVGNRSD